MSIQTELARLTNAKAAIQAAIEGKGVTVPSGTLLDGMASLIEGIEAGGVQFGKFTTITYGSFVPTEDISEYTIYLGYKGAGRAPVVEAFVLIRDLDSTYSGTTTSNSVVAVTEHYNVKAAIGTSASSASMCMYYNSSSSISRTYGIASYNSTSSANIERNVTLKTNTINSSLKLTAGATYSWIAMRREK